MSESPDPSLGQEEPQEAPDALSNLPAAAGLGVVAILLPMFFSFSTTTTINVDGARVAIDHSDPITAAGGIVAVLCALFVLFKAVRKDPVPPTYLNWLFVVGLAGAGAWQALHGLGIILPSGPL